MGRLAQLVERHIDVVNVTGSTPVPPTNKLMMPERHRQFIGRAGSKKSGSKRSLEMQAERAQGCIAAGVAAALVDDPPKAERRLAGGDRLLYCPLLGPSNSGAPSFRKSTHHSAQVKICSLNKKNKLLIIRIGNLESKKFDTRFAILDRTSTCLTNQMLKL